MGEIHLSRPQTINIAASISPPGTWRESTALFSQDDRKTARPVLPPATVFGGTCTTHNFKKAGRQEIKTAMPTEKLCRISLEDVCRIVSKRPGGCA
jgi:hypothetical protein